MMFELTLNSANSSSNKPENFYFSIPKFYEGKYQCETKSSHNETIFGEYKDTTSYIKMKMLGYNFKINKIDKKLTLLGKYNLNPELEKKLKIFAEIEIKKSFPFKNGTFIDFNKTYLIDTEMGSIKLKPVSFSKLNGMNVLNLNYKLKTPDGIEGRGLGAIHLQSGLIVKTDISGEHSGQNFFINYECNFTGIERLSSTLEVLLGKKRNFSASKQNFDGFSELDKERKKRKELERKLAALENKQKEQQQTKPKIVITKKLKSEFSLKPIPINFPPVSIKGYDIAVIIGNADYKKMGKDIPNVNPAYADAEGIKQYFMKAKGVKEGNIIYLKDATGAQLLGVFGNEKSHKGKLFNYIKPNKSNVYVYYAGHGAPGKEGDAYLVPTDTDSQTIEFTGYPLSTLYSNLGKLPAKSMTVILEACFSGGSQSGSLISKASPIIIQPKKTFIPNNIKVIAAGSQRQMASWEEDGSHSLFTKYFLKAMSGEGDSNKDGKVSDAELKEYLSDTMTYYARRYYGRDQKVQIHNGK